MSFAYISTDLNIRSSGGLVAKNELEAMKLLGNEIITIDYSEIHPTSHRLPDIPLFIDYLTLNKLSRMDLSKVKLVHMYGASYTQTIRYLKSQNIKTTNSIMFHNRQTSIEEHEKYFGSYPFNYVKDNRLWNMYIGGLKEADLVITSGIHPKNNMINEGIDANKIEIIHLGCDLPDNSKIMPIPDQFDVAYLGQIGPDKGLIYLIKAWEYLNYKDSTLIFAGSQCTAEGYLPQFINARVKRGNYHLMGYVNEVSKLYNACSVYIQPSASESFGLEVPEAMSYGRPVIVSDGAGAADCITDGVDGFVVPRMDFRAIAEKIDWFKNHSKELREMGKKAKENARKYIWDITRQKYANMWNKLLNNNT